MRPPRRLSFTRDGKVVVALAIAIGLAAVNTGNNLLYLLLGWILSAIIASGIFSESTLRGLRLQRRAPGVVYAGQPFLMEFTLDNGKRRRASYAVELEDLIDGDRPGGPRRSIDKRCFFLKVPAASAQTATYRHTFVRRGRHELVAVRVATRFPFGLFRKSRDVELTTEVLVYPALVPVTTPAARAETRGDAITARRGRRGEFFGLREHRRGDDRRDVHWRSSARSGRLLVREYEDELARDVTIAVDNALPAAVREAVADGRAAPDALAPGAALERAISHAASRAVAYLGRGWSVALCARGLVVPAGAGRAHEARLLRALALLETTGTDVPLPTPAPRAESVLVLPREGAAGAPGYVHVVVPR